LRCTRGRPAIGALPAWHRFAGRPHVSCAACSRQFGQASASAVPHRMQPIRGPERWNVIGPRLGTRHASNARHCCLG
jgi:hypothetical protein